MNLYFQFSTWNQSYTAIKLVSLPAWLVSKGAVAGEINISAGGRLSSSKFSNIETWLEEWDQNRFNECEVTYHVPIVDLGGISMRCVSLNGVFYPFPTSQLWFPSQQFPTSKDRRVLQRRMNAKAREQGVADCCISAMPCVFEVALEIETSHSDQRILDACAEWLAAAVEQLEELEVFGCCDLGGKEMFVHLESHVLMLDKIRLLARVSPLAYAELGRKIEDLHPIMFGTKQIYSEIALAIGEDAKLVKSATSSKSAVIRLESGCDIAAARHRAKDWILPKIQ